MDRIETLSGFQSIVWTFVRHTVSRCLIFPARQKVNTLGFLQFITSGQYGLCLGYFFSGPLPLRSHFNSPPFGVYFQESLVSIDYTQRSTRSTLALKLSVHGVALPVYLWVWPWCGTARLPMGDCHTSMYVFSRRSYINSM